MEKRFYWIYVTVFINIISFGMVFPILPLFARSFEATSFQVGLLIAIFSLTQFFFAPLAGRLSDRYGRKVVFIISIALSSLALLTIGLANSLTVVFLGMALQGLGSAGVLPAALAYIADITDGHKRSKYISRVTGTFALGFMIGPALGGFLGNYTLSLPFLGAAFVGLLNLFVVMMFLQETHHKRDTKLALRSGLVNPKVLFFALKGKFGLLFFLLFAWSFYIANFSLTTPFFTQEKYNFGAFENGIFFSTVGLIAGIIQWFVLPSIEKKIGDVKIIFYGLILLFVGQAIVPLAFNPTLFYLFFTVAVIGSALMRPSTNALLSKRTEEGQGTTMGLAFSFESSGRIVGPILLGYVITYMGVSMPFYVTAIILLIALLLFYKYEMKRN